MQSESFSFRKTLRMIFHTSSDDEPVSTGRNLSSSGPIGEGGGVAMSAIETALASLKEASSLAGHIPYISPVAGLLLQVLTMRDEVKQHKDEWDIVMRKLGRVAGLVVNVGESCQKYNLEENDLPLGLRAILQSLQSELRGIEGALKRSTEMGRVEKVLLRKDLLRKVKQYDGELSNVLQTFQAELVLDVRFAQLVEGRKVSHAGPPGDSQVMSITQEPRSPQIFFGRDAELAEIIQMIFTGIRSRPARIAILGPGGYGKTTLANAVLTHSQVHEHFRRARYFVACESIFSSGALLVELAKTLGVLDGASDASWSHIDATLNSKDTIICLDNFESPWDQAGDIRYSVEELLSRITAINSVTLLVTMRGTVRPAQTQWTKPPLTPLRTLSQDAAKEIWEEIGDNYDKSAEELIKAVDYVPLAVTLLAHLAQATTPSLLLKEWNQKQTRLIQMGHSHRLSNLESSIQLSIDSGRMAAYPPAKDLLGILSLIPDGIHTKQLERFQEILVNMDLLSSLRVLQQCSLINVIGERYQTHPIIRHFCSHQDLMSLQYKGSLQEFYIDLASSESYKVQAQKHAEMVLEVNNTKAMLFYLLKSNYDNQSKLVNSILTFTLFHASIGDLSDKLISQTIEYLKKSQASKPLLIRCHQTWGKLYYFASSFKQAKDKVQEAEKLCSSISDKNGPLHATLLRDLGELHLLDGALNEAEASYQKALELHIIAKDVVGQGSDYKGLGDTYLRLRKLDEAEASYEKALEFHKLTNNALGQGNDHFGLGGIYLQLKRPADAETSYKNALDFHKIANDALWQGNDHKGLGNTYTQLNKLDEAITSYRKALEFHKIANNILGQGNDYRGLGDTYLQLGKLDEAEASFKMALEFHKMANNGVGQGNDFFGLGDTYLKLRKLDQAQVSYQKALESYGMVNNVLGQGNALHGLGKVYMEKSQLEDAKSTFQEAITMHQKAHAPGYKGLDQMYLDKVLSKMGNHTPQK